jgi:hypothetical protein
MSTGRGRCLPREPFKPQGKAAAATRHPIVEDRDGFDEFDCESETESLDGYLVEADCNDRFFSS